MKSLVITGPGESGIQRRAQPARGDGESIVAPRYVGLCGTDLEVFMGVMPYLKDGLASYPIQPGHEVSGIVVVSDSNGPPIGTAVAIDPVVGCGACEACARGVETHCADRLELGIRHGMPGGAAELVAVPTRKLHVVPADLSLRAAVLVEPGVTSYNAVKRFGDVTGKRALVLGPGTLGCIAAQLLLADGASVDMADPNRNRGKIIEELGARRIPTAESDAYDLVVEAMGAPSAIHDALSAVAAGGQIAVLGVQPSVVDGVDMNTLVFKDATMFGVLNGPGLYDELIARMTAGDVTPEILIEDDYALDDASKAFGRLTEQERNRPKVLLRIDAGSDT